MGNLLQKFDGFKECSYQNGKRIALFIYYRRFKEKIYNRFFLGRKDFHIDPSSQILGMKYIKIGKDFRAGKHFWIGAISEHNGKNFLPKIIIGDNVSFSDFGHVGAIVWQ